MKKSCAFLLAPVVALLLSGCTASQTAASSDIDLYMTQFGEYENNLSDSSDTDNVKDDSTNFRSASIGGEQLFEDTRFDGKPVVDEEEKEGTSTVSLAKETEASTATSQSGTAVTTSVKKTDSSGANTSTSIGNPTENNTASSSGENISDTGSGVGQTCDEPYVESENNDEGNDIIIIFE